VRPTDEKEKKMSLRKGRKKKNREITTYGGHDCSRVEGTRGLVKLIKRASHLRSSTRSSASACPPVFPAMSDREGHSGLPPTDDDLSLPKATVAKMITGSLSFSAPSAGL
jgi:hypothetical protein